MFSNKTYKFIYTRKDIDYNLDPYTSMLGVNDMNRVVERLKLRVMLI